MVIMAISGSFDCPHEVVDDICLRCTARDFGYKQAMKCFLYYWVRPVLERHGIILPRARKTLNTLRSSILRVRL